jgi:hypothetical protein
MALNALHSQLVKPKRKKTCTFTRLLPVINNEHNKQNTKRKTYNFICRTISLCSIRIESNTTVNTITKPKQKARVGCRPARHQNERPLQFERTKFENKNRNFVYSPIFTSVGHNRYISIIELIEIIALYNGMIIRIVRL